LILECFSPDAPFALRVFLALLVIIATLPFFYVRAWMVNRAQKRKTAEAETQAAAVAAVAAAAAAAIDSSTTTASAATASAVTN